VQTDIARNALTADGSPQNSSDELNDNGITADECAAQIINAMKKHRNEVIVGTGVSVLAPRLKRLSPRLYQALAARYKNR